MAIEISRSKLEQMTQEELYQLTKVFGEYTRAKKQARLEDYIKTAHEGQLAFHRAEPRIRLLFGGNRSGKSTAGVVELLWRLLGRHPFQDSPVPIKAVLICQDFSNSWQDVLYPKILEWLPEGVLDRPEKNQSGVVVKLRFKNGSVLDVKSHDQDPKIFESSDYDLAFFDEPPPQHLWKAVWRGLTDRGGRAYICGTPITEPWMHDLYSKAVQHSATGQASLASAEDSTNGQTSALAEASAASLYWALFVSTYQNAENIGEGDEALGRKRIQEFEELLDEDEREARIEGRFLHMRGRVFKSFDRGVHLIQPFKWPHDWPLWCSVDPHPRKPWAVAFLGLTPSGVKILVRSFLADGTISEVGERILEERDALPLDGPVGVKVSPRFARTVIDYSANVESWETKGKTVTDLLTEEIYPVMPRCTWGPKNVKQKILLFQEWLKKSPGEEKPRFMVFDGRNERFLYEVEHYVWRRYKGERRGEYADAPVKRDDDILDAVMQCALLLGASTSVDMEDRGPVRYAGSPARGGRF